MNQNSALVRRVNGLFVRIPDRSVVEASEAVAYSRRMGQFLHRLLDDYESGAIKDSQSLMFAEKLLLRSRPVRMATDQQDLRHSGLRFEMSMPGCQQLKQLRSQ